MGWTMIGTFASGKRTNVVRKTEQLQTTLIGVFASMQNRSQQTINTLSQHAASPRAAQEMTEFFPGRPELGLPQFGRRFIQALLPQPLLAGLFQLGPGTTLLVSLNLPQPPQGSHDRRSITSLQRPQPCGLCRLITEQVWGPILEIGRQLVINATRPVLQLLAQSLQLRDALAHILQLARWTDQSEQTTHPPAGQSGQRHQRPNMGFKELICERSREAIS